MVLNFQKKHIMMLQYSHSNFGELKLCNLRHTKIFQQRDYDAETIYIFMSVVTSLILYVKLFTYLKIHVS